MNLLNEEDKERIATAIAEQEARTSGDIVTVVLSQSDEYRYILLLWSLGAVLLAPAVIGVLNLGWPTVAVYGVQVGLFLLTASVLRLSWFREKVLPRSVKQSRARQKARAMFVEQGVHATPENNAIMIFVSELEHHVEIIADHGINSVVPDGFWRESVNELTGRIKAGKAADGLVHTVEQCGDLLARHFPSDDLRESSLSNDVIDG